MSYYEAETSCCMFVEFDFSKILEMQTARLLQVKLLFLAPSPQFTTCSTNYSHYYNRKNALDLEKIAAC